MGDEKKMFCFHRSLCEFEFRAVQRSGWGREEEERTPEENEQQTEDLERKKLDEE